MNPLIQDWLNAKAHRRDAEKAVKQAYSAAQNVIPPKFSELELARDIAEGDIIWTQEQDGHLVWHQVFMAYTGPLHGCVRSERGCIIKISECYKEI
jgi:hypothetical protein